MPGFERRGRRVLPAHPRLLEIDTRSWLARLSGRAGRRVKLADVADLDLDEQLAPGFDLVWLMGVWERGSAGRRVARGLPWMRAERERLLPDGSIKDIGGSPFAIAGYQVAEELGGDDGLAVLRHRLAARGVGLVLDFVPNHTALDHPWVRRHPERYVQGTEAQRIERPEAYLETRTNGRRWIAHGRDPYFPPWTDTAQLDYRHPEVHEAMRDALAQVATRCDGVRCDMAMLVLDDVFRATWSDHPPAGAPDVPTGEFWWEAIRAVRRVYPAFLFMAEAYWDTEWRLQQLGFDHTYDKRLLDRLVAGDAAGVVAHLRADEAYQRASVRFLENHDEPRAATRFAGDRLRVALLTAAAVQGMLMLQEGEVDGARIRPPVQLVRRPEEPVDPEAAAIHREILGVTRQPPFPSGICMAVEARTAWPGNETHERVLARLWVGDRGVFRLVVVNLADSPSQAYLPLAIPALAGRRVRLEDLIGPDGYDREGDDLLARGLYVDLPADAAHVFRFEDVDAGAAEAWQIEPRDVETPERSRPAEAQRRARRPA
ncbi:MAG TPA: alpha-amylase family glycosyl hydrolase [Candidatus Dormibacteraeota bacterium]|nr:alpha-amylase family glycosyl hydrolase [Candidatus Dormibacteraeota bacterium]